MKSTELSLEEFLEKNKNSTSLMLNGKMIGNTGLEKIALQFRESKYLQELWLAKNQIDNEGLNIIVKLCESNPSITYLDLRENKISTNGIEGIIRLLKNPNLSQLYLAQNNLGDESIKKISQSLKTNDSLTYLGLNSVKMHSEGLEVFLEALKRNTSIKGVDLLGRRNDDYIFKGSSSKKELENLLTENSKFPDKALARKVAYQIFDIFIEKKDTNIEEKLNFLKCYEKADKEELESKLNAIFSKSLIEMAEEISQFIKENTGIEDVTPEEGSILTQSTVDEMETKDPKKLLFEFISQDKQQMVIELMQLKPQLVPRIIADDMKKPDLIDPDFNNLMTKLMQIRPQVLDIMEPEGYQTMEFISESKDTEAKKLEGIFKSLIMKYNRATSEKEIKTFQHFVEKFLNLMIEKIKDAPKNIDLLLIMGNMLNAAEKFSDAIDFYTGAKALDSSISTPIDKLSKTLAENTDKNVIELNNQNIDSINAVLISKFIKTHKNITDFILSHTQIKNEGLEIICSALESNTAINNIVFFDCKLNDEGAKIIAKLLKIHTSLQGLHLPDNQIEDGGAKHIIEALKYNSKITKLYIEGNKIDKALIEEINEHVNGNMDSASKLTEKFEAQLHINDSVINGVNDQVDGEVDTIGNNSTINE